jgi:hypothetical protein
MAYYTRQLIIDAYYLSGIVSRTLETVNGDELNDGLERLNDFLTIKGADTKLIPYYTEVNSNFITGQEVYFIPNLVEIDTLTFFLPNPSDSPQATIRFQMLELSREEYFAVPRAENVSTLPYIYHLERVYGGSNLYVYFLPNEPYAYQMWGKFSLLATTFNQDLSLIYDEWYLAYLKYGLAIWLCEWRSVQPPASLTQTFYNMEQKMTNLGIIDFTHRKLQWFKRGGGLNWGDANYGHGWRSN